MKALLLALALERERICLCLRSRYQNRKVSFCLELSKSLKKICCIGIGSTGRKKYQATAIFVILESIYIPVLYRSNVYLQQYSVNCENAVRTDE